MYPELRNAAERIALESRYGTDQCIGTVLFVVETGRQADLVLLHTALHREIRHIDPADENIVRAQVQRNGVALVPAADIEVRDEEIAALDVVGRTGERENIALRIEQERKLRPFGQFEPGQENTGHVVRLFDVDFDQVVVIHRGGLRFFGTLGTPAARSFVERGQVGDQRIGKIRKEVFVAEPTAEFDVGKRRVHPQLFAFGIVLRDETDVARTDRIEMVDIDHVADGRLPVHVVECRARAHRHQVAAHDRHRIALVEVQPVQVGPIELQREIIGGHRIVESQLPVEIERQVFVLGLNRAEETAVVEFAVEFDIVVIVTVVIDARQVGFRLEFEHAAPVRTGDAGRKREPAQFGHLQQATQVEPVGTHLAAESGSTGLQRLEVQFQVDISLIHAEPPRCRKIAEQAVETSRKRDAAHPAQPLRIGRLERPPGNIAEDKGHVRLVGFERSHVERKARAGNVRNAVHAEAHAHARIAAIHARQVARHRGHGPLDGTVHMFENGLPVAQRRGEKSDRAETNARIDDLRRNIHLLQEIVVAFPRTGPEIEVVHAHARVGSSQGQPFETHPGTGNFEIACRQGINHQPAALFERNVVDRQVHAVVHNRNVVYAQVEPAYIEVGKIHPVIAVTPLELQVLESHVADRNTRSRQPERFFLLFALALELQQNLFEVRAPRTVLHQVELRLLELDTPQRDTARKGVEALQRHHDTPGIKHRILMVIFDIQPVERHTVEKPQPQFVDMHFGLQFPAEPSGQLAARIILHRRKVQQQRAGDGQNDQREEGRR